MSAHLQVGLLGHVRAPVLAKGHEQLLFPG